MARSTFYYHIHHSNKVDKYEQECKRIVSIYHQHKGRYGYRRIYLALRNEGFTINHKTVERIMSEHELKSLVRPKKYKSYKDKEDLKVIPNIVNRNFIADRPLQKLVTDVSEIKIAGVKGYLSPLMDLFNGEILSYTFSSSPNLAMVTDMLKKGCRNRKLEKDVILHSDQGYLYHNKKYIKLITDKKIAQSMSRKGNCYDNAVIESFFGILKSELLYLHKYNSMQEFENDLKEYIKYYNNDRIKMKLNGMSPVKYRVNYQNINKNVSNF